MARIDVPGALSPTLPQPEATALPAPGRPSVPPLAPRDPAKIPPATRRAEPHPPSVSTQLRNPARLAALHATPVLDARSEEAFDRLTRLATKLLGVPVALASLVDADRQHLASQVGLPEPVAISRQLPLSHSFCQYVVADDAPLVVQDAREHPVLRDSLAVSELGLVAYCGVPLRTPNGQVLGALCAIDGRPRV